MKNFRKMLYLKIAKISKGNNNAPVPSIIGFGTKIKGDILGGDVIHIDGRLEGNICCEELIIGIKGQVIGQVKAKTLSLYGTLQGTAEADNLFIAGTARLTGDALHNSIAIEPGAYIEGRCVRMPKRPPVAQSTEKETPVKKAPAVEKPAAAGKVSATSGTSSALFKAATGSNK